MNKMNLILIILCFCNITSLVWGSEFIIDECLDSNADFSNHAILSPIWDRIEEIFTPQAIELIEGFSLDRIKRFLNYFQYLDYYDAKFEAEPNIDSWLIQERYLFSSCLKGIDLLLDEQRKIEDTLGGDING